MKCLGISKEDIRAGESVCGGPDEVKGWTGQFMLLLESLGQESDMSRFIF